MVSIDAEIPGDVAIDLIGRRPDIVSARLRVEAVGSRIDADKAGFYPNINVSVLVGWQSLGLRNLIDTGSLCGSADPAISLPIFDGGRVDPKYRQSRGQYDEAVANYEATLVCALCEVATAAASRSAIEGRIAELENARAAYVVAVEIARLRYTKGLADQFPLLDAQDREVTTRRTFADLQARRIALDIELIRALGGGCRLTSQANGT